ncbi:MAG TPA: FHA domain-containing protein [Opitutaceae bacterium]|nr:FHA domain-containing protein [Opitutaceae bacterium]
MTTEELCAELACPPETPAGGLLAAWERRRAELDAALEDGSHPRPVKLRLREERRRLDEAESLAAGLKRAAEAESLLEEFRRESAKDRPGTAVLRLCLERAQPLIAAIGDDALRFAAEKRLALCADELDAAARRPPPPPPRAAAAAADPRSSSGEAEPGPCEPGRGRSEPRRASDEPRHGSGGILELVPVPSGETLRNPRPRYRIIVKDTFVLGRQSTCDCVARYALDTEENRHRLSTISRRHTTLFARGGQLFVADGADESTPSRNGTVIDEQRVAGPLPLNFAQERRFVLGQFGYEIRVQYFPEGFVRFLPPPAADRSVLPIWLLSAATVGASPTAALRLDAAYPPLVARILCRNNTGGVSFFLEVPKNVPSHVSINGSSSPPGATVALQTAQLLQLGNAAFTVCLS